MTQTLARPLAAAALLAGLSLPAHAADVVGEWIVADQTARVRIAPCADALCGTISWTKTPGGVDEYNPDTTKRTQPLLGLEIIKGMRPVSATRWEGSVYNAQNGRTYSAALISQSPTAMRIEGCLMTNFLCGGETWARAPETTGSTAAKPAPSSAAGTARAPQPR
jgi:uncharacterized protein (DUF2147 family)